MFELAHGHGRGPACRPTGDCSRANSMWPTGAVKHQRFVGTAYFDQQATVISAGKTTTCAMPVPPKRNSLKIHTTMRFPTGTGVWPDEHCFNRSMKITPLARIAK